MAGFDPRFDSALNAFLEAGRAAGFPELSIVSGYRSPERQAQLWEQALQRYGSEAEARRWVAPTGRSFHNQGLAADIGYGGSGLGQAPPEVVEWLHSNAGEYGLHFPLSNENWHVELAGTRGGERPSGGISAYATPSAAPSLPGGVSQGLPAPQGGSMPTGAPTGLPPLTAAIMQPAEPTRAPEASQSQARAIDVTEGLNIKNMSRARIGEYIRQNYAKLGPQERVALARSLSA